MIIDPKRYLIVITGPTAVGKTSLTLEVARFFNTEILSADSRQFYREMSIGTARPGPEELQLIPHHFIGHISVTDEYNVSRFETYALNVLSNLFTQNDKAILTGGSGLYINAVCNGIDDLPDPDDSLREELKIMFAEQGIESLRSRLRLLDPVYYDQVDIANPKRLLRALEVCITTGKPYSELRKNKPKQHDFEVIKIGLERDKKELYDRINERVDKMMDKGLLKEVEGLLGYRHLNALNTVGYKEFFPYFSGEISLDEAIANVKTHSRRYAKRQMTWFRKDESITWFHPDRVNEIINFVQEKTSKSS
jgi:tRNA dimethylallyltransferase